MKKPTRNTKPTPRRVFSAILAISLAAALLLTGNGITQALQVAFSEGDPLQRIFSILEDATGDPQTVADFEQLANIAISQEDYDLAIEHIQAALALEEEDTAIRAALYTKLGSVYALQLDYDAAQEALTHALAITPEDAQALILRAQVGIEQGAYAQAVQDLEGYLAQAEDDAGVWTVMAQLYEAIGEYEKARESYAKAYAIDDSAVHNVLNSARNEYLLGNYAAAIEGYDAYLTMDEDADGTVHFLRGVARMQLAEYEPAIGDLQTALDRGYAERALTYEQLSICYYALERYEDVLTIGKEAVAQPSEQITYDALYQRMGVSAMTLERYDEGDEYLTQSIDINADLEGSYYYRGVCRLALEQYEDAAEDFTASIGQGFLPQFCYYNRGVCYVQLGDYENALNDMEQTLLAEEGDESLNEAAKDILWQIAQYYMAVGTPGAEPPTAEPAHELDGADAVIEPADGTEAFYN